MNTVFVERNAIKPNPKIGINYTEESLEKSITAETSDLIAEFILKTNSNNKICIFDFFAGIGSASLAFLDRSKFKLVISFERHKVVRDILKNNIHLYGEKFTDKSLVKKYEKKDDLSVYTGASVFVNLKNVPVEDLGLVEEILEKYKNIFYAFFIYDESKTFILNNDDLKTETKVFDNFNLIVALNSKKKNIEVFDKNKWGLKHKPSKDELVSSYTPKTLIEAQEPERNPVAYSDPVISWKKFCSELKECNPRYSMHDRLIEYQKYLKSVLLRIVPNESDVNSMITEEYMPVWILAITHETYDLTANYEKLETHGDSILDYCMKNYILERFPNIESRGLAEFKSRYMSHEFQHIFTHDMKLHTWVLLDGIKMNSKIEEDMFESFVGALLTIGNKICPCLGIAYVQNFLTLVLSDTEFDMSWIYGKPKTTLQQRGTMLKLNDVQVHDSEDEEDEDEDEPKKKKKMTGGIHDIWNKNAKTVKIEMSEKLIEFLRKNFAREFKNPLVEERGFNKDITEDKAWKKALDILNKAGYNAEFAQEQRAILSFKNIDKKMVTQVHEKGSKEGYSGVFIRNPNKKSAEGTGRVFILQGTKDGLKQKMSIASDADEVTAKTLLLKKYLERVDGK